MSGLRLFSIQQAFLKNVHRAANMQKLIKPLLIVRTKYKSNLAAEAGAEFPRLTHRSGYAKSLVAVPIVSKQTNLMGIYAKN